EEGCGEGRNAERQGAGGGDRHRRGWQADKGPRLREGGAHVLGRAATYGRQPPYSVISRWPSQSTGSPSTPSVSSPSARRTLPTQRPGGSPSKTVPIPAAG